MGTFSRSFQIVLISGWAVSSFLRRAAFRSKCQPRALAVTAFTRLTVRWRRATAWRLAALRIVANGFEESLSMGVSRRITSSVSEWSERSETSRTASSMLNSDSESISMICFLSLGVVRDDCAVGRPRVEALALPLPVSKRGRFLEGVSLSSVSEEICFGC